MKHLIIIVISSLLCSSFGYAQFDGGNNDGYSSNSIIFDFSSVSETYVPDDNFESELISLGYDSGVLDNRVATANIVGITSLNLKNKGISDMTGIQDFIALTVLAIGGNNISSIDLSKNTALLEFSCNDNFFNNLDLTNNIALTHISFSFNSISNIELSLNIDLAELSCTNNNLSNLDLSLNTALTLLDCSNNILTSLNVKNGNNSTISNANFSALSNNLVCIKVDDTAYSTTNWTNIDIQTSFGTNCNGVLISPKIFLQGSYINYLVGEETWMRDNLRTNNLIPTTSPYSDNATCDVSVFIPTGANAIVDWVWVELRDENDNTNILNSKSALLQRDGDIVNVNGTSPVTFFIDAGNYYVSISHRNHLGIISANTVTLSSSVITLNLLNNNTNVDGGSNAVATLGNGFYGLYSGDYDGNGQIQNTDTNAVVNLLGNSGYSNADINLNGQTQNTDINISINPNIGKGQQYARQYLKLYAKQKE